MEHTNNSSDPSPNKVSAGHKERYAGDTSTQRIDTEKKSVNENTKTGDASEEITPPEALERMWSFMKKPEHANGIMAFFTILIGAATTAYAVIALLQWSVMSSQLDLTRREMKGTQAAIVRLAVGGIGSDGINIGINNAGHWIATDFRATLEIHRESLPDHANIGSSYTCSLNIPQVPTGDFPGINQMCSLPKFSDLDWDEIQHTTEKQTIKITAAYSYDDGFGDVIPKSICQYLFTRPPYILKNGTSVTPVAAFYDCDRIDDILESYRRNKR